MRPRLGWALALVLSASVACAQTGGIVPPPDRDVTPPGVTPPPAGDGPLIRIPAPLRPPEPPRWWRFELPMTTDSATFEKDGMTIRVSGVTAPRVDEVCADGSGGTWPCGRLALTNLRKFLRGRTVECYFPYVGEEARITAPCRVGRTDIGDWLLTQGWAAPDGLATDDYRSAALAARCAGRGIWRGETPPDACPPAG